MCFCSCLVCVRSCARRLGWEGVRWGVAAMVVGSCEGGNVKDDWRWGRDACLKPRLSVDAKRRLRKIPNEEKEVPIEGRGEASEKRREETHVPMSGVRRFAFIYLKERFMFSVLAFEIDLHA